MRLFFLFLAILIPNPLYSQLDSIKASIIHDKVKPLGKSEGVFAKSIDVIMNKPSYDLEIEMTHKFNDFYRFDFTGFDMKIMKMYRRTSAIYFHDSLFIKTDLKMGPTFIYAYVPGYFSLLRVPPYQKQMSDMGYVWTHSWRRKEYPFLNGVIRNNKTLKVISFNESNLRNLLMENAPDLLKKYAAEDSPNDFGTQIDYLIKLNVIMDKKMNIKD